jgi:uncharacterized protein YcbK (DUF882 family)
MWDFDRWKYFKPEEVLSPAAVAMLDRNIMLLDVHSLDYLCELREKIGFPILVNYGAMKLRGYRSPSENDAIKGAPFSFHIQGKAFDITCRELSVFDLGQAALSVGFTFTKIISDSSVHIDTRWKG